jgi:predicted negative regulator of RcsB-dependent stress response
LVVAEMKTEEEQVEALKRWWQENGKSLILTIAVSVGGVLSWNAYQDHQTNESELASVYFQQLMTSAPAGQLGETEIAEIRYNSDLLKKEFSASTYAQFAALMIARVEVQEGNLAAATTELEWVIAQQGDVEVRTLATLRLAKLLGAQNQYDEALALLVDADDAWQLGRLETRGDLLVAQGDLDAARAAYTEASLLAVTSGTNNPLLGLKLDNLAQ